MLVSLFLAGKSGKWGFHSLLYPLHLKQILTTLLLAVCVTHGGIPVPSALPAAVPGRSTVSTSQNDQLILVCRKLSQF